MPQSYFWEAVFLPQLDLSSLSRHQLVPGHKHPAATARAKGKRAQRPDRDLFSPAGGSVRPEERGETSSALQHPFLPLPAPWLHRGPDHRGTEPGKRVRK